MSRSTPSKSSKETVSAPYPTAAQSDYIQNGLILPKDPKNLELLLKDVHQKGFFDLEFCYQLRQRESVKGVEQQISNQLQSQQPIARDKVSGRNGNDFVRMVERCLA